jgi:L-serine dehydratase
MTARMAPAKSVGIFNHVLGPVMRGPSSSHTAGAYHIACMARDLLGAAPRRARFAFDPSGSYAVTYAPQGADRGFAMGLMGRPLTDESFFSALPDAARAGLDIAFEVRALAHAGHPNAVEIELEAARGAQIRLAARSIGGGEVEITRIEEWPVLFRGAAYEVLVETEPDAAAEVAAALGGDGGLMDAPETLVRGSACAVVARRSKALSARTRDLAARLAGTGRVRESSPVYFVQTGAPLFESAAGLVALAETRACSLGRAACAYEAALLGMREEEVVAEMLRRYDVMAAAVARGLAPDFSGLQLLRASAGAIFAAEAAGRLATKSLHTRAAARAMAVMHVDGAMGVVCAAPTGGSAGALPGAVVTLAEERKLSRAKIAEALLAAGAIGVIVAQRATFAAEVAGCQVEIGAAGAMAAAAVVDGVGGSARQACDAAAIAFQNTMGSVCDLVHGMVEIPCHTRNAAAAASAFVCADLILGGYENPIPLDETIDAVLSVGRMLPAELRCTSRGGLAIAPSALALEPKRRET